MISFAQDEKKKVEINILVEYVNVLQMIEKEELKFKLEHWSTKIICFLRVG